MKFIVFVLLGISVSVVYAVDKDEIHERLSRIFDSQDVINSEQVAILNGIKMSTAIVNKLDEKLAKSDAQYLFANIVHPDLPTVGVELNLDEGKDYGVSIFQRETGVPNAVMADRNGDGVFDLLTYSVLDKEGNSLMEVEDFGVDGQIDLRLEYGTGRVDVYYEDKWYTAIGSKNDRYIDTGSGKVLLKEVMDKLRTKDI